MFVVLELFDSITFIYEGDLPPPGTLHVILGDEKRKLPVKGYGTIKYQMYEKVTRQFSYHILDIGDMTLVSIKQHSQFQGDYFHYRNNQATLPFPSFLFPKLIWEVGAIVMKPSRDALNFDESKAILLNSSLATTAHLIQKNKICVCSFMSVFWNFKKK